MRRVCVCVCVCTVCAYGAWMRAIATRAKRTSGVQSLHISTHTLQILYEHLPAIRFLLMCSHPQMLPHPAGSSPGTTNTGTTSTSDSGSASGGPSPSASPTSSGLYVHITPMTAARVCAQTPPIFGESLQPWPLSVFRFCFCTALFVPFSGNNAQATLRTSTCPYCVRTAHYSTQPCIHTHRCILCCT